MGVSILLAWAKQTFLSVRGLAYLGAFVALVGTGWAIHHRIDAAGYDRCRAEWTQAVGEAKGKRDAELTVLRLRGDALSKALAEKERKFYGLQSEYLTYANSITGVCDPRLGVLVAAASTSSGVPPPAGPSADPARADGPADTAYAKEVAAAVGANVAINYPACARCISRLNALLDWHATSKEVVK